MEWSGGDADRRSGREHRHDFVLKLVVTSPLPEGQPSFLSGLYRLIPQVHRVIWLSSVHPSAIDGSSFNTHSSLFPSDSLSLLWPPLLSPLPAFLVYILHLHLVSTQPVLPPLPNRWLRLPRPHRKFPSPKLMKVSFLTPKDSRGRTTSWLICLRKYHNHSWAYVVEQWGGEETRVSWSPHVSYCGLAEFFAKATCGYLRSQHASQNYFTASPIYRRVYSVRPPSLITSTIL
jgi:hypothetical protein